MKQEIMIVVVRVCRPCQNGWRCLSVLLVDVDVEVDAGIGIEIEIETIVVGSISYLFLSYNALLLFLNLQYFVCFRFTNWKIMDDDTK